jgi:hypothetical protein
MPNIFFDKVISVYKLEDVDGTRQHYTTWTTTIDCTIQPLGDSKTALAGGSYGKMYKIFIDVDTNIKDGDKIKDKLGNWYEVMAGGVENRNDGFIADYMSLTVKKINFNV